MKKINKKILASSFLFCAAISSTATIATIVSNNNNNINTSRNKFSSIKTTATPTPATDFVYPSAGQTKTVNVNGATHTIYTTQDSDFDIQPSGEIWGFNSNFNPGADVKINLVLPSATKSISEQAFSPSNPSNAPTISQHVSNIVRIDLSQATGLTSITQNAFLQLPVLTEVKFNNTLTDLGAGNFNMCPKLTTLVDFDKTKITEMSGAKGFSQTSVKNITLPSTIQSFAFDAIPEIQDDCSIDFSNASNLTSITDGQVLTLPNHVAFYFPDNFNVNISNKSFVAVYNYYYLNLPNSLATPANLDIMGALNIQGDPLTQQDIDNKMIVKTTFHSQKLKDDYPTQTPSELKTIFDSLTNFEKTKYISVNLESDNAHINPMAALRDVTLNNDATDIIVGSYGYAFKAPATQPTFTTTITEDTTSKIHELTLDVKNNEITQFGETLKSEIDKWNTTTPRDLTFKDGLILSQLGLNATETPTTATLEIKNFNVDSTNTNKYTFEISLKGSADANAAVIGTIKFGITFKEPTTPDLPSSFETGYTPNSTTGVTDLNWDVKESEIQKLEEFLRTDIDKWNKTNPKDNNFTFGSILSELKLTASNLPEGAQLELKSFVKDPSDPTKHIFEIAINNAKFPDGSNSKTIKFGITTKPEDATAPKLDTTINPAIDNWEMTPEQLESFKTELNNNVADWNKNPTASPDFNIGKVLSQLGLSSSNLVSTSKLTVSEFTVDPKNPNLNKFTVTLDDGKGKTTSIQYQILLNQNNNANNPNSPSSSKITEAQVVGIAFGILMLLLLIILIIMFISKKVSDRKSKNK